MGCVIFYLVCYFLDIIVEVRITTLSCLTFIHLNDKLGINKYLLIESDCEFKLFYNKK